MKTLLITAFEPFGGEAVNASIEAVTRLPEHIGNWKLMKKIIPVVFREAAEQTITMAEALEVDAVLCIGQAAGRNKVTPELVALNLQYAAIPDNMGNCPKDSPVVKGGENALFATMPIRTMAAAITAAGLPGAVSYSAGSYVCNDIYYELLHYFKNPSVPVGFIHVPALNTMASEQTAAALEAAIAVLD
ncbi:MAG: pyroglutamyl-peptidase I [Clostridia bacterium]|nr:pyroglutamyl-peptidase I [Clostridia bacterium]